MAGVSFDHLTSSEFEEFCFDLLQANGFVNLDWRKGTGLTGVPADKGRDIIGEHLRTEPDGSQHLKRWFVDCKYYKKGVPAGRQYTKVTIPRCQRFPRKYRDCTVVDSLEEGITSFLN